jgi:eukaryotic-like serine/threonine-protein kinase
MSNELTTVRSNWTRLEDATLDGGFVLKQMIGADDVSATFRTTEGAVVKAYRVSGEAADEQLQLWREARKLQHPNLIRVLGSGRTELEGENVIFVALESTDESLDGALRERPLDRDEATAIVLSVVEALGYLHSRGFVHGYLSPETVYAIGDSVRLSPEGIRAIGTSPDGAVVKAGLHRAKYPAPEQQHSVAAAADVWSLGATLYESLTQRSPAQRDEGNHASLPAPFQTIVQRELEPDPSARITLPELRELVEKKPEIAPVEPAREPAPVAASIAIPVEERVVPPVAAPSPTGLWPEPRRARETAPGGGLPRFIYALIAVVVIAGLIVVLRARNTGKRQQQAAVEQETHPQPARQPAPPPISQAKPSPLVPAPSTTRTRAASKTQGGNNIWRVVVYTYNSAADARRRAAGINVKHPEAKAEVFSPTEGGAPYLVVIGGQMTRDQASLLRQQAVRMGLPRDSYMQNYNR